MVNLANTMFPKPIPEEEIALVEQIQALLTGRNYTSTNRIMTAVHHKLMAEHVIRGEV
jgi:hypothetical protein